MCVCVCVCVCVPLLNARSSGREVLKDPLGRGKLPNSALSDGASHSQFRWCSSRNADPYVLYAKGYSLHTLCIHTKVCGWGVGIQLHTCMHRNRNIPKACTVCTEAGLLYKRAHAISSEKQVYQEYLALAFTYAHTHAHECVPTHS